jgi:hypothetical protein
MLYLRFLFAGLSFGLISASVLCLIEAQTALVGINTLYNVAAIGLTFGLAFGLVACCDHLSPRERRERERRARKLDRVRFNAKLDRERARNRSRNAF